jgi:hypothetical protein
LHGAIDDDAVERRANIGALEIDAGAVERRLVQRDIGLGVFEVRLGAVEVGLAALLRGECRVASDLGARASDHQLLRAVQIELGLVQIGFGAFDCCLLKRDIGLRHGDGGLTLPHPRLEGRGLDAGKHLVLLHLRAVIDVELADIAGKLRANIDADQRADRAGGRDHPAHIALLRRDGLDVELRVGLMLPIIVGTSGRQAGDKENREPTRSHFFRISLGP